MEIGETVSQSPYAGDRGVLASFTLGGPLFVLTHAGTLADRFFQPDFQPLAPDPEPQPSVKADQMVRDPDERQPGDEVAAPVVIEQTEARQEQHAGRHVMAEAVLTGEEIKELSGWKLRSRFAPVNTVVLKLAKQLFVSHRPGDCCHRQSKHEQFQQIRGGDVVHAATRRAARLRSFTSTRRI